MLSLLIARLALVPEGARVDPRLAVDSVGEARLLIAPRAQAPPSTPSPSAPPLADPNARRVDFVARLTDSHSLARLDIPNRENGSYTVKTLACAMWALRRLLATPPAGRTEAFFVDTLRALVSQGGDASANGAVAGAILGAVLGYAHLPASWLQALPNHAWLTKEADMYCDAVSRTWSAV